MESETLRGVEKIEPLSLLNGAQNVFYILVSHSLLIGWFWAAYAFIPFWLYVPGSIVAALIHQRALSEWIHEAAHFNLVPKKKWNDLLINALAGVWFVNDIVDHRSGHLKHHSLARFFAGDDPDTRLLNVRTRAEFWKEIAADLCGRTAIRMFFQPKVPGTGSSGHRHHYFLLCTGAVHLLLLGGLFTAGRLDAYLLYYFTLATFYPLLNRIRVYGQHAELDLQGFARLMESKASRTIDAGFLDRLFITSRVMMYHHEHHLWAGLHYRALMKIAKPSEDPNRFATNRWQVVRSLYKGLT